MKDQESPLPEGLPSMLKNDGSGFLLDDGLGKESITTKDYPHSFNWTIEGCAVNDHLQHTYLSFEHNDRQESNARAQAMRPQMVVSDRANTDYCERGKSPLPVDARAGSEEISHTYFSSYDLLAKGDQVNLIYEDIRSEVPPTDLHEPSDGTMHDLRLQHTYLRFEHDDNQESKPAGAMRPHEADSDRANSDSFKEAWPSSTKDIYDSEGISHTYFSSRDLPSPDERVNRCSEDARLAASSKDLHKPF